MRGWQRNSREFRPSAWRSLDAGRWRRAGQCLRPQTLQGKVALSLIAHLVILFLIFNTWWFRSPRLKPSGTKQGVQAMVAYVPGKTVAVPQPRLASAPPVRHPNKPLTLKTALPDLEAAPASSNALGDDEVSLAWVTGFPPERPDLSGVGQSADIIMDVEIDNTGHVTRVHARKGIGIAVDAIVVATVEQWIFHPALRGGMPVGSTRELHFRFDRSRSRTDCGWDCFALTAD